MVEHICFFLERTVISLWRSRMCRKGLLLRKCTCRGSVLKGCVFLIPLYETELPDLDADMPSGFENVSTFSLASFTVVD